LPHLTHPPPTTPPQEVNEDGLLVFTSTGWNKFEIQYPDEPKYTVTGADSQVATIQLAGSESIYTEPGTMMYMSENISSNTECGGCFQRCCSGEVRPSEE